MQLPGHLFTVVYVAGLLYISLCQDCKLQNGEPGQAGVPGRDGWLGQKGEKGEPGLELQLNQDTLAAFRGDKGEQGPMGDIGIKGYQGLLGPPGPTGPPGPIGGTGSSSGDSGRSKAAFSVLRTEKSFPRYNHPVAFNQAITNFNNDFNLEKGQFTCNIAGVYYFVFHSVSEGNLCLQLMSDSVHPLDLLFCDFNRGKGSQVVSGGAVIKLAQNNKVWIQPFKNTEFGSEEHNRMSTKSDISAVFNGFLIFTTG